MDSSLEDVVRSGCGHSLAGRQICGGAVSNTVVSVPWDVF